MKKLLTALIATALLALSCTVVRAADLPDEQRSMPRPPVENTGGYSGAFYDDQRTLFRSFTYLESWPSENFVDGSQTTCKSATEEPCKSSNYLFYETPLSPCSDMRTRDCVIGFSAKSAEGDWISATLVETETSRFGNQDGAINRYNTPFTGDPTRGIPDSGFISIWKIPGVAHANGDEYLLIPKLNVDHQTRTGSKPSSLDVGVFPVSRTSSNGKSESDCFLLTQKTCFIRWAHPEGSSFRVSIQTGSKIVGWFHGRIYEPTVSSSKTSDGQTKVTVEGQVMRVPTLAAWAKNSELPAALDAAIEQEFIARGNRPAGVTFSGGNETSRALMATIDERNPSFSEYGFDRYLQWIQVAKDKAYSNPSTWSFRTMESADQYSKCIGDSGVAGMVTTNSNAYLSGPPIFKDGVLSYRVSSPHYDSKGAVQIGTYDLAIRSDIARCIYGFTNAPIQASISVVYDDGVSKSATTLVTERDNWLRLSAKGFTYSSPTVKVAFTQPGSVKAAPKKSTITCIKGKTKKKVTGTNPKCPSGYKKSA